MADRPQKKILLAQLNSNGDCLYATVIAKQIKEVNYRGAYLTWAVNSKCKQSVLLNPHVDEIWEVPTKSSLTTYDEWTDFVQQAEKRKAAGEFDKIFYTQIIGATSLFFDGGIRSTTYLFYPHKITVSQRPVIRLSSEETAVVKKFADVHNLAGFKNVLLIECGPDSFKSALNPQTALEIAAAFTANDPGLAVILSSNKKVTGTSPQIIDGSVLSFRANAELTKYCTLFAGCSSGISWLITTDWAKPLPKVILRNDDHYYTNSMVYDHKYAGLPVKDIIELKENENSVAELQQCLSVILNESFEKSRELFHIGFRLEKYDFFYKAVELNKMNGDHTHLFRLTKNFVKRNGFRKEPMKLFFKMLYKMPKYIFKYKRPAEPIIHK